ncbi:MAG: DUF1207 domain-containing protein [Chlorobiaceae bacterium]
MTRFYYYFKAIFILVAMILVSTKTAQAEEQLNPTFKTLFTPLLADPTEPRIAVMPWLGNRYLQLDIGATTDLYQSKSKEFSVGIDFATYSLLRRTEHFKFPVDAIDYLFGVNSSWKKNIINEAIPFDEFSARARISHISAHFEDGHYNAETDQWLQQTEWLGTTPFTYSREFVNFVFALSTPNKRVYAGYQYIYHTLPDGINPNSFQAGAELSTPRNTYLAADFKLLPIWQSTLNETKGHRGTWNLQAGMQLNAIGFDKVRIAYNYFSGISRHGMYFYRPENYSTVGIIINL